MKKFFSRSFGIVGFVTALNAVGCGGGDDASNPGPGTDPDTGFDDASADGGGSDGATTDTTTATDTATPDDTATASDTATATDTGTPDDTGTDATGADGAGDSSGSGDGATDSGSVDTGPACTDMCTVGATICDGTKVRTCAVQSTGCTDYGVSTACPAGQSCTGSACADTPCTADAHRCAGHTVQTCNSAGAWVTTTTCAETCDPGTNACVAATTCAPGAARCNGTNVDICNSSGNAWLYNQTCIVGCSGGVCTDPCTTGAKRCNGKAVETCNAAGTGWTADPACSTDCYDGACVTADLIVDGVTVTMGGEHVYSNSVIVRNGGQIKVDTTGALIIRAKTVSIDASSSIVANAVGDDTRGATSSTTCNLYSHCHSGYLCCNGATDTNTTITMTPGGSGYGTVGGPGPKTSPQCTGTDVDPALPACPSAVGPTYDRDDDLSISKGSKSGTKLGGGLIAIYAQSVTVNGQITANADPASSASGGGILIAADTITGSGPIQASGGTASPVGGLGRVKLLRGATNSESGSVTGKSSLSVMPPLKLVSGSHPDSTKWYNDGLGDLFVAWDRPFSTVNNYYYLFTQNVVDVPSDALGRGTFFTGESVLVPAANLKQGQNYFHIVSVDSGFNIGAVENKFLVNVNTVPPTITSASHPVERTWYSNPNVSLDWANPQADSNFTGYYYVIDQYADTVPSATSGATFTTNKKLIVSGLPTSAIRVMHVVNRDTRGATTRAARHFIIYVGPEPTKTNVTGSVFDGTASSAPLSGVTITINRGLFSTTTTASGTYTFGGNLYVGDWEITASKPGYKSETKKVSLLTADTTNLNFTLTK